MIDTLDALATSPVLPDGIGIPAALQPSVLRHQQNLAILVHSLRSVGLDETMIERSIRQLIDSYRDELMAAMRTWVWRQANG